MCALATSLACKIPVRNRPCNVINTPILATVTVIGFPIGGDTMSVTSGVVSRIEVTSYVHGSSELLGIQIDAAINSGMLLLATRLATRPATRI